MPLKMTEVGERLSKATGIAELMDDLGAAMTGDQRGKMHMLGGGAPAAIPAAQQVWRQRLKEISADPSAVDRMLGVYDAPAGGPAFRQQVAQFFRQELGWPITEANVAVTAGGQAAFFQLFTLFGSPDQPIVLPLSPEYIGYADQGWQPGLFRSHKPRIEEIGDHDFKYHIDFEALNLSGAGAVCLSRPTNPSGNVLPDAQLAQLIEMARQHDAPVILDNAYGRPFPGAVYTNASSPAWDDNLIRVFSLSKLGLPGARTGIVIASEEVARRVAAMTAVIGLANNNVGQAIAGPMLPSGEMTEVCSRVIRPFYQKRAELTREIVDQEFGDDFPYRVHLAEGAFFLWFWLPNLPIPAKQLYQKLKQCGVLILPGEPFFFGLPDDGWAHREQCFRVTFSQSERTVRDGIAIIAELVRELHG